MTFILPTSSTYLTLLLGWSSVIEVRITGKLLPISM